jgi:WD40 repeat protein
VDSFGDPLPPGAVLRLGTVRLRHILRDGSGADAMAFSPNGKVVVSAGDVGVRAWDVATGKRLSWLAGGQGTIAVHFRRDGKTLTLADKHGAIEQREVGTGKRVHLVKPLIQFRKQSPFQGIAGGFSADGKVLALSDLSSNLVFVEAETGAVLLQRPQQPGSSQIFFRCAVSPDGKNFVSNAGRTQAELFTLPGAERRWAVGHRHKTDPALQGMSKKLDEAFLGLSFSPDGKTVAAGGYRFLHLFDTATGDFLRDIPGSGNDVLFSPDGKYLAAAWVEQFRTLRGEAVRLYEVASGKEVRRFEPHAGSVHAQAFSPDGKMLVTGEDHTISLWDVATGTRVHPVVGHQGIVNCLAASVDGAVGASGGNYVDPCVILWDLKTGKLLHRLPQLKEDVSCVAFSPDGQTVAVGVGYYSGQDGKVRDIRLWDVRTGELRRVIPAHLNKVAALKFSRDGKHLASYGGKRADKWQEMETAYWEVASGKRVERADHFPEPVRFKLARNRDECLPAVSPDGAVTARCLAFNDPSIHLTDNATGKTLWKLEQPDAGPTDGIRTLLFTADGTRLISGSRDTTVLVWNVSQLTDKRLDLYWEMLQQEDAPGLAEALAALGDMPERSLAFLKTHLRPASPMEDPAVARLIAELDSEEFAAREKATAALEALGKKAERSLHQAARVHASLEVRKRAATILKRLGSATIPSAPPEEFAARHAIPLLERLGSVEAREVLQKLAAGAPEATSTLQAAAALKRMSKRDRSDSSPTR